MHMAKTKSSRVHSTSMWKIMLATASNVAVVAIVTKNRRLGSEKMSAWYSPAVESDTSGSVANQPHNRANLALTVERQHEDGDVGPKQDDFSLMQRRRDLPNV